MPGGVKMCAVDRVLEEAGALNTKHQGLFLNL